MITKVKSDEPIRPLRNVTSYSSWKLPSLSTGDAPNFLQPVDEDEEPEISAEEQEKIFQQELADRRQKAYQEGFEQGRQAGIASGQKEMTEKSLTLASIIEQLAEPTKVCQEKTQDSLVRLAFAIARQIVRRELKQDPTQLIAIIREALKKLPIGSADISIILHPEDESVVASALSIGSDAEKSHWQLKSNPSVERGSCQVVTENSRVDASIDKQIAVLFSQLVGGQRAGEGDAQ